MPVQTPTPMKMTHPSVLEEESPVFPIVWKKLSPEEAKKIHDEIRGLSGPTRRRLEAIVGIVHK